MTWNPAQPVIAILESRFLVLAIMLALAVPANAGPFEDGATFYGRGDCATALRLWRPLAVKGIASAQHNLGVMSANGEGVPRDDAEALKWWRLAAEQGFADARYNLGLMYAGGRGVPRDDAEAVASWRPLAIKGYAPAQYNLGVMYAKGRGVKQDLVAAHMWLDLAATQNVELARTSRDIVAGLLSLHQLDEARRLAREWITTHRQ